MALLLSEPFNSLSAWTLTGTPTIVSGRNGTAINISSTAQRADYDISASDQSDTITLGFAWRHTDALAVNRNICQLHSDDGATQHNLLQWNKSSGLLIFMRGGITLGSTTFAFVQDTWYYIEVQARLHDTAGFGIVRIDGTEVINTGPVDTKLAGTKTVYDQVRILSFTTSTTGQYDDLYLRNDTTFQGDAAIVAPCNELLREPFENLTNWTSVSNVSLATGATDGAFVQSTANASAASFAIFGDDRSDWLTLGFHWRTTSAAIDNHMFVLLGDGVTNHVTLTAGSTGRFYVWRGLETGGASLGNTATGLFVADTWYFVEMRVRLHDTAGRVILRVDGVEVLNLVNVDTRNAGTEAVFSTFKLRGVTGATQSFDDLYIDAGEDCDFLGPIDVPANFAVLEEDFDVVSDWTYAGTAQQKFGNTGLAVRLNSAMVSMSRAIPAIQQSAWAVVGFAHRPQTASGRPLLSLLSDSLATTHLTLVSTAAGAIEVRRGSSTGTLLATSSTGVIAVNTWAYIEVRARLSDTAGTVQIRVNGITVLAETTALDTKNAGTKTVFDGVAILYTSSTSTQDFDDLYVLTGFDATFLGPQRYGTGPFDVIHEPFRDLNRWSVDDGSPSIVAGRTGSCVLLAGTPVTGDGADILTLDIPPDQQSYNIIFGCALWATNPGSVFEPVHFRTNAGASGLLNLRISNAGVISVAGALAPSAAGAFAFDTWQYVEVRLTVATGTASAAIRVNGVEVSSEYDVVIGTVSLIDTVQLRASLAPEVNRYDDLYILTGTLAEDYEGDQFLTEALAEVNIYSGGDFVSAPVRTWDGSDYVDALAVRTWNGSAFVATAAAGVEFSGGTVTDSGGYRYHTFTASGTLTAIVPGVVDYLVVAGGGGGGGANVGWGSPAGGGGGGGVRSGRTVISATSTVVTVGAGGAVAASPGGGGFPGGDSVLGGITATGGGGGGGRSGDADDGGSAGGGGSSGFSAAVGIVGQGHDGGVFYWNASSGVRAGGGGGGAGAVGTDGEYDLGGAGGAGVEWPPLSGVVYAGGGAGGHYNTTPTPQGGSGGGGTGGHGNGSLGGAATPSTGGGGGGGSNAGGGVGGSGIVIVRYVYP